MRSSSSTRSTTPATSAPGATAIRHAFEPAARRLALSGTPFRSDTAAIPFVRYDALADGDTANSDYTYGYADALRDGGVVRPVYFPRIDGVMEWSAPDGSIVSANFHDELARDGMAHRLRTALSLDGDWLPAVLRQAHERLMSIRTMPNGQPEAGGLVIAIDQQHAQGIAQLIRRNFGVPAEVVVSDDPTSSVRISKFAAHRRAVAGRRAHGQRGRRHPPPARRRVRDHRDDRAVLPPGRRPLRALAERPRLAEGLRVPARRPAAAQPCVPDRRGTASRVAPAGRRRTTSVFSPEAEAAFDSVDEFGEPEQLSLFSALSAVATGIVVHTISADGVAYDDEPDSPPAAEHLDDSALVELDLVLPDIPTDAGFARDESRSVAEVKDDLRAKNAWVAQRLVDLTGLSHGKVNAEMNRLAGVTKVTMATTEQLERRLRYAESWLRRTRGATRAVAWSPCQPPESTILHSRSTASASSS